MYLAGGVGSFRLCGMIEADGEGEQSVHALAELVYSDQEVVRMVDDGEFFLGPSPRGSIEDLVRLLELVEALG